MRILITGSRDYTNYNKMKDSILEVVHTANTDASNVCIVHGGASGADYLAGEIARELGFSEEVHYADWKNLGRKAGPLRNQKMVDLGADICIAFPKGESRGTRNCMKLADKAGIEVIVAT